MNTNQIQFIFIFAFGRDVSRTRAVRLINTNITNSFGLVSFFIARKISTAVLNARLMIADDLFVTQCANKTDKTGNRATSLPTPRRSLCWVVYTYKHSIYWKNIRAVLLEQAAQPEAQLKAAQPVQHNRPFAVLDQSNCDDILDVKLRKKA